MASENLQEMMAIIQMEQRQIFFIFVQNGKSYLILYFIRTISVSDLLFYIKFANLNTQKILMFKYTPSNNVVLEIQSAT